MARRWKKYICSLFETLAHAQNEDKLVTSQTSILFLRKHAFCFVVEFGQPWAIIFQAKLKRAMQQVKLILDSEKCAQLPSAEHHSYDDKFSLVFWQTVIHEVILQLFLLRNVLLH